MTYLPPQEIEQVSSLWTVIADPAKYKKLADQLIQQDKGLDEKKDMVSGLMDEYRVKNQELLAREKAVEARQAELDSTEADINKRKDELVSATADLGQKMTKLDQERSEFQSKMDQQVKDVLVRETSVANREAIVSDLEQKQTEALAKANAFKAEFEDKLAKLKSIV